MVQAYILIRVTPGSLGPVLGQVSAIPAVVQAHAVTGPTDVIAFVETDTVETLGRLVISRLQQIEGVSRTTTCVVTAP